MTYLRYGANITIHGPQPLALQSSPRLSYSSQLLLFKLLIFFSFFSLCVRDNKKFFHPKSKLHAMQNVGTHDILSSSFIKTLLLFLLAYVRETTFKIRRSTDHSTNTEHFNAGRSNFFNIAKTKIFDVAKLSISIPLKLIFECRKI